MGDCAASILHLLVHLFLNKFLYVFQYFSPIYGAFVRYYLFRLYLEVMAAKEYATVPRASENKFNK